MIVEETIHIDSSLATVWETFTNLACWEDWNSVLKNVSSPDSELLKEGSTLACTLKPFFIPIQFEPEIQEIIPQKRVVWTGEKHGIFARHEFNFKRKDGAVHVTSRETFTGLPILLTKFIFPEWKIRKLTNTLLKDLKRTAESITESKDGQQH